MRTLLFTEKMSVVVWRGIKFFANLVRCKVRGIAKIPVQRIAEVVRARFYHGAKFRLLLIFALVVIFGGSKPPHHDNLGR